MKPILLALSLCLTSLAAHAGSRLNDVHSQLNPTEVAEVLAPKTIAEARAALLKAKRLNLGVSLAGGRHSMGGQQFGAGTLNLDLSGLNRLISIDTEKGLAVVEAGIQWPKLVKELLAAQAGRDLVWTISQKQTGADDMSIGGALSSNVHGRGLKLAPFVGDVESFWLLNAQGK